MLKVQEGGQLQQGDDSLQVSKDHGYTSEEILQQLHAKGKAQHYSQYTYDSRPIRIRSKFK